MTHYLDTSVLVALLTPEVQSNEVESWLSAHPSSLATSDWTVTEFSSALSIKLRTGQIEDVHRAAALTAFFALLGGALRLMPLTRVHFENAARIVDRQESGLRAGDALHLAVAREAAAELVTLDKLQAQAATSIGVTAHLI
ncbi:type II toxin-antitoxin system VapC family toxin [Sphingobium boeckii]|uniref:Ribonuclease VapC n=1 Tax=Sphingobium boeckii TaxID=1082345 RepID=A0A7W9ED07_9SPHN|nr:type II toxin-antitoxin system VapC family toxin [Sphingobium boeckii]MBB5684632.1 hypothetical protein [Sphingobium boeckii]